MTEEEAIEACTGPLAQTEDPYRYGYMNATFLNWLLPDKIEADLHAQIFEASGFSLWSGRFSGVEMVDLYVGVFPHD